MKSTRRQTRRARKSRGPVNYVTSPFVTLGKGAANMVGNVARTGANVLETTVSGLGKAVSRGSKAVNRSGRQILGRTRRTMHARKH